MRLEHTFDHLQQTAQLTGHRHLLWLNGDQSWCYEQLKALKSRLCSLNSILITDKLTVDAVFNINRDDNLCRTQIVAKDTVKHLGTEFDCAVYDGFSGVNPDYLAQITGTLCSGGILIFVTPGQLQWRYWQDGETKKLIAPPYQQQDVSQHFLAWLQRCLYEYSALNINHIVSQASPEADCCKESRVLAVADNQTVTEYLPRAKQHQQNVVEQCVAFLTTHQTAAVVITAARGRGKSVALAMIAKHFDNRVVYLTAAEPAAVEQVQRHAQRPLLFSRCIDLLALDDHVVKSALLLIDEAAGISVDMLIRLTKKFSQVILATTTQGYEGTGQGFALKFHQYLQRSQKPYHFFQLDYPMRWALHDPLEEWLNNLLFLNMPAPPDYLLGLPLPFQCKKEQAKPINIFTVNSAQLLAQPRLLQQVYTLLSQAHYRTTPGDLRLILDSPNLHLWLACESDTDNSNTAIMLIDTKIQVRAVCLVAEEGVISDFTEDEQGMKGPDLAQAMSLGLRRAKGNLIPQILIAQEGFMQAQHFKIARVVRIATDSQYRRAKLASKLLASIEMWCIKREFHYLATSFSLQEDVIAFWKKMGFCMVRIGSQLDNISASYSALAMKSLHLNDGFIAELEQNFVIKFGYQRQRLNPNFNLDQVITLTCNSLSHSEILQNNLQYYEWCLAQLTAFSYHHRPLESVDYILSVVLKDSLQQCQDTFLSAYELQLAESYLFKHHSLADVLVRFKISGYRSLVKELRKIGQKLLLYIAQSKY
jgi:tRNA(Met) cytidine acetyltransferase